MKPNARVIKALRVHSQLKIKHLSDITGLSRQAIYDIEASRVENSQFTTMRLISAALRVPIEVITDDDITDEQVRRRIVRKLHATGMGINQIAALLPSRNDQVMRDINQAPTVVS